MQTQGTTAKKLRTKESRPKETKLTNGKNPAPLHSNEPAKLNQEKIIREWLKKKKTLSRQ